MTAKLRIKCTACGNANNIQNINDPCPDCRRPHGNVEEGCIYVYRQGSPFGSARRFGVYINGEGYGYIGNTELLRIPVKFGKYNIHAAMGAQRKCRDMEVEVTPENPAAYAKIYLKPGFWTNTFVVVPLEPEKLGM